MLPHFLNPTNLNHESKEDEGRTVEVIDAGDGVSLKTPRGRQRETTYLFFQVTDDG